MRHLRIVLVVGLCVPLFACFEEAVREHVHLTLRGDGPVIVTVVQDVADPRLAEDNEELANRMEESRNSIENNLDPWSRRFALELPLAEHMSIQRVEGKLRRSVHSAVLSSFDEVAGMIEADGLTGDLAVAAGVAELSFYPTGSTRATYTQRQEAERLLNEWSDSLATYFETAIDLYTYLERNPDRAVPCFAQIFDVHNDIAESAGADYAARLKGLYLPLTSPQGE